jgi:hypothetical protein
LREFLFAAGGRILFSPTPLDRRFSASFLTMSPIV